MVDTYKNKRAKQKWKLKKFTFYKVLIHILSYTYWSLHSRLKEIHEEREPNHEKSKKYNWLQESKNEMRENYLIYSLLSLLLYQCLQWYWILLFFVLSDGWLSVVFTRLIEQLVKFKEIIFFLLFVLCVHFTRKVYNNFGG